PLPPLAAVEPFGGLRRSEAGATTVRRATPVTRHSGRASIRRVGRFVMLSEPSKSMTRPTSKSRTGGRRVSVRDLDGNRLLYPYLQHELLNDDIWLFQMLTSRLVTALGVWFHPRVFKRLPILFPHVVRDESARGRKAGMEQWASPNDVGYLRDDNSLIKEA